MNINDYIHRKNFTLTHSGLWIGLSEEVRHVGGGRGGRCKVISMTEKRYRN